MFTPHFTDQGEVWKRMQGMFHNSGHILRHDKELTHETAFWILRLCLRFSLFDHPDLCSAFYRVQMVPRDTDAL